MQCLTSFEPYADSIWHPASYANAPADAGYWGDGGSSGNGGIRGNGGVALAYAVLVVAYPSDPRLASRLGRLRQALNFNAGAHVTGTNVCTDGHNWGWSSTTSTDWQTSEWTGSMGLACLLAQSQLPASTVQAVQRVIASEATHRAGIAPTSGYVANTRAEENAWDSNVLALGAAWLSSNTNAALWLTAAKRYLANTYTVASTNGDPLSSWLTTINLYPDFALENHGFYHPLYQMCGMSLGDSLLMARLANPTVATQLLAFAEHNVLNVWTNLSHLITDSGELGYPSGLDWDLHAYQQNAYFAWLASHFNQPLARWADGQLAQLELYRQGVNTNGAFVGPSGGGFYREAVEARRTAIAWLHWANADYSSGLTNSPVPAFEHLPDVGIIAHRGAAGLVGLCYGPQTNGSAARIMAIVEPPTAAFPTNTYVTTPRLPGIIGLGALGNPTGSRLVSLITNANGFTAELQLTNGANGTTEVYLNNTGETVGLVEVPWPATGVTGSFAGSFSVGIENDPLIGGSRLLEWTGGSATITNRSGVSRSITNGWLCVGGRYGLAAGPAGYFSYQAASAYNRPGAAEDTLQFVPQSRLAPRYAVWFPGKSATATMSNASQVSWTVSGTNGVLTFLGVGGNPAQISAVVAGPPAPPANLAAAAASTNVLLSWSPSSSATNYHLKRSAINGGPYATIASTVGTSYTNAGLVPGATLYYVVSAVNSFGEGSNSTQISATTATVPAAPGHLTAIPGDSRVSLGWDAVFGALSYHLKRSTTNTGTYAVIANVASTVYTNAGLVNGTKYYYVVSAVNSAGESTNSSQVFATPSAPLLLTDWATAGTGLVINGRGGLAGKSFYVLGSTDVAAPMAQWTRLATNVFGLSGSFSFTNAIDPALSQQFYMIESSAP